MIFPQNLTDSSFNMKMEECVGYSMSSVINTLIMFMQIIVVFKSHHKRWHCGDPRKTTTKLLYYGSRLEGVQFCASLLVYLRVYSL